jgi:DNA polymerase bacteriophage-type
MRYLYIDTETYSTVPIDRGLSLYVPACELLMVQWALDDGPVIVWDMTASRPPEWDTFCAALSDPAYVKVFHNSAFDRRVLTRHAAPVPVEQIHDTMVQARSHALPGDLAGLCAVLGVPLDRAKSKADRELMLFFSKPGKDGRHTRETHPAKWREFLGYGGRDVEAMRECHRRLPAWNYTYDSAEWRAWVQSERINDRGMPVDRRYVVQAIELAHNRQEELADEAAQATDNYLGSTNQRALLLEYLAVELGVTLGDLTASSIERALNSGELPAEACSLLTNRLQTASVSVAKYKRVLTLLPPDDRLYGAYEFCGAGRTGRWSAKGFQPHNMPRPDMSVAAIMEFVTATRNGIADLIYPDWLLMRMLSNGVRGMVQAKPGHKLAVADLSNIEGRKAAWLAGEAWKLAAFSAYDQGTGPDLYRLAYARAFGVPPEEAGGMRRQIGKVLELSMGYQGGVGAFVNMAANYGVDLDELAAFAGPLIPPAVWQAAMRAWEWAVRKHRTYGLSQYVWLVCDSLKRLWRAAHPAIVAIWELLESTIREVIAAPADEWRTCGTHLTIGRVGHWLLVRLPSGRFLCYPNAHLVADSEAIGGDVIAYWGVHPFTHQWREIRSHGGKFFENICQASAADNLRVGIEAADNAGYPVVLHSHDELVCEVPDMGAYSGDSLAQLLCTRRDWMNGLPLAAKGYDTYIYGKDE